MHEVKILCLNLLILADFLVGVFSRHQLKRQQENIAYTSFCFGNSFLDRSQFSYMTIICWSSFPKTTLHIFTCDSENYMPKSFLIYCLANLIPVTEDNLMCFRNNFQLECALSGLEALFISHHMQERGPGLAPHPGYVWLGSEKEVFDRIYVPKVLEIFTHGNHSENLNGKLILASHYSATGDTISWDAPYSAIGFRGKFFLRCPPC